MNSKLLLCPECMSISRVFLRSNLSIDTDPQQQKAASPLMLVVRSFLRYTHVSLSTVAVWSDALPDVLP